jgi:hypothetical protein
MPDAQSHCKSRGSCPRSAGSGQELEGREGARFTSKRTRTIGLGVLVAGAQINSHEATAASALRGEETGRSRSVVAGKKPAGLASWLIRQGENAARQI